MLVLNETSKTPLYIQLYEQIKADIFKGILQPGAKLKSSREVSMELHISRNTVKLAYELLFAEGFITSRLRKGYYVEASELNIFQGYGAPKCEKEAPLPDQNLISMPKKPMAFTILPSGL